MAGFPVSTPAALQSVEHAGAALFGLSGAICAHHIPTPPPPWWLEISHGGNIYSTEIGIY